MDPKRTERQAPRATSTSRNITSGSSMRPFQSFVRNAQKSAVRAPSPSEWPWPGPWLPDPGGPEFAAPVGRPDTRLGGLACLLLVPGQPGALLHAPPPLPGLPWQPRSFLPWPALRRPRPWRPLAEPRWGPAGWTCHAPSTPRDLICDWGPLSKAPHTPRVQTTPEPSSVVQTPGDAPLLTPCLCPHPTPSEGTRLRRND